MPSHSTLRAIARIDRHICAAATCLARLGEARSPDPDAIVAASAVESAAAALSDLIASLATAEQTISDLLIAADRGAARPGAHPDQ